MINVRHQLHELVLGQQAFQFNGFFIGITTRHFVQRAAAHQFVDDVTADAVVIFGDDAHTLLVVEARGEIVHHQTVDPSANKTDNHHVEGVNGEGGAADDGTRHRNGRAYIKMQVFVDNLGQDVQTSCRGVDLEKHVLGGDEQEHKTSDFKSDGVHQEWDSGTGLYATLVGEVRFQHTHHRTQNQGRVNGFNAKLLANQEVRENQQDGINHENNR